METDNPARLSYKCVQNCLNSHVFALKHHTTLKFMDLSNLEVIFK